MHSLSTALDLAISPPSRQESGPVGTGGERGNVVEFPGGKEKSLVRTVGCLALQGMSANEIAHTLDMSAEGVQRMFDDPMVQDMFRREVEAKGRFALKKLVAGAAIDVVVMLMKIVSDERSDIHAKLKAGKELLDRGFGKPMPASKYEGSEGFVDSDPELALAKINSQIEELTKQTKQLKAS